MYTPDGRAEVIGTNTTKVLNKHIRRVAKLKQKVVSMKHGYTECKAGLTRDEKR
jgi:hypothetical protein